MFFAQIIAQILHKILHNSKILPIFASQIKSYYTYRMTDAKTLTSNALKKNTKVVIR